MTDAYVMVFFPLLMAFAAISDMATMIISNRLTLLLAIGFFPAALLVGAGPATIGMHVLCGLAVLALAFAMFSTGLIGGGDAKLAAATALWIGWDGLLDYGLVSALAGGVLTLLILASRKVPLPAALQARAWIARLHDPRSGVPYGVALAVAGLMTYPGSLVWLRAATA